MIVRETTIALLSLAIVVGALYAHIFVRAADLSYLDSIATLVVGYYFGRGGPQIPQIPAPPALNLPAAGTKG